MKRVNMTFVWLMSWHDKPCQEYLNSRGDAAALLTLLWLQIVNNGSNGSTHEFKISEDFIDEHEGCKSHQNEG